MPINTNSFAKALYPGVNSWYGKAYDEFPVEWNKLFDSYTTRRAYEEDVGVTSFGLAQKKPEGQSIMYDEEAQTYVSRYMPVVYALGFIITREIYEDDLYDIVGERKARGLAFSMRQTKEIIGANVYNRAFNSSYIGGDGVSLCNSAHPNWAGGVQSNISSTSADFSLAALEQASIDIQKWENDRGLRIAVKPNSLHIPVELEWEAIKLLQTAQQPGTANNDVNPLRTLGMFPGGVHVNHYFTDADAWFIRTNVQDGMKYFERRGMEFGIDNDFDTENAKFKATERYVFGWTDWRSVYGSQGG